MSLTQATSAVPTSASSPFKGATQLLFVAGSTTGAGRHLLLTEPHHSPLRSTRS